MSSGSTTSVNKEKEFEAGSHELGYGTAIDPELEKRVVYVPSRTLRASLRTHADRMSLAARLTFGLYRSWLCVMASA